MRILILVFVAIIVWLALEGLWKEIRQKLVDSRTPTKNAMKPESLIPCARCGVYIPLSRAQSIAPDRAVCRACVESGPEQTRQKRSTVG
jgi:hypothetical protein